jgi:hypothetical protein
MVSHLATMGLDSMAPWRPQKRLSTNPASIICMSAMRDTQPSTPRGHPLGFLLRETQLYEATVASDRVYGVLGLSTELARNRVPVDYSMPYVALMHSVSRYVLLEEQSLDLLMTAGTGFLYKNGAALPGHGLPSWVPESWDGFDRPPSLADGTSGTFRTATFMTASVSEVTSGGVVDERLVAVTGTLYDFVTGVSDVLHHPDHHPRSASMKRTDKTNLTLSTVESAFEFARAVRLSYEDIGEAVCTTIGLKFDESHPVSRSQSQDFRKMLKLAYKAVQKDNAEWPDREFFADAVAAAIKRSRTGKVWTSGNPFDWARNETTLRQGLTPMFDRRMCRTARGAMGLVPPLARPGDRIAVFAGANVPCVLRARLLPPDLPPRF